VDIGADSTAGMLVVTYADNKTYVPSTTWAQEFIGAHDDDTVLEQHEKVQLTVTVPTDSMLQGTEDQVVNREFKMEIKPKVGAIVPITRVTPPQLDGVMVLK
jgi:flagellin FlaB